MKPNMYMWVRLYIFSLDVSEYVVCCVCARQSAHTVLTNRRFMLYNAPLKLRARCECLLLRNNKNTLQQSFYIDLNLLHLSKYSSAWVARRCGGPKGDKIYTLEEDKNRIISDAQP